MGAGHWFPKPHNEARHETDFRMVYMDLLEGKQAEDAETEQEAFDAGFYARENLEELLDSILPASFVRVDRETWVGDDSQEKLFAQNGQLMVTIASNQHLTAVVVRSRDDLRTHEYNLAETHLSSTSDKIFDALADDYELAWRTGPYTSAPYIKSSLRA